MYIWVTSELHIYLDSSKAVLVAIISSYGSHLYCLGQYWYYDLLYCECGIFRLILLCCFQIITFLNCLKTSTFYWGKHEVTHQKPYFLAVEKILDSSATTSPSAYSPTIFHYYSWQVNEIQVGCIFRSLLLNRARLIKIYLLRYKFCASSTGNTRTAGSYCSSSMLYKYCFTWFTTLSTRFHCLHLNLFDASSMQSTSWNKSCRVRSLIY